MDHKGTLSSAFNMSLGFIPVIISILLCEFITQDTAIYIGTGIGIVGIYLLLHRKGALIPNFILYIATGMLALLSLAALIPGDYVPPGALPLTLEVSILIPMLILYMHKKRFINHFLRQIGSCNKRLYAQGAEAAVVSARFALIFGILHFIIISTTIVCTCRPDARNGIANALFVSAPRLPQYYYWSQAVGTLPEPSLSKIPQNNICPLPHRQDNV